jgi:hypothetical protein
MFSPEGAVKWVGDNPVLAGGAIFVVGLGALYAFGFFGSSTAANDASSSATAVGAYYDAVNADNQANAAEVIDQQDNTAATAQLQIQADAYTAVQNTWASTSQNITDSNNAASEAALPFALEASEIGALSSLAALPPIQTASKSSGFFGIGASSKVVSTPNPAATNAASGLLALLNGHNVMTG